MAHLDRVAILGTIQAVLPVGRGFGVGPVSYDLAAASGLLHRTVANERRHQRRRVGGIAVD